MRFVYKIMLGLIIFNAMLYTTAPFFTLSAEQQKGVNLTSGEIGGRSYGNIGDIGWIVGEGILMNWMTWAIIGVFTVASAGIGMIFGGAGKLVPIAIAIGFMLSIFISIWNSTINVVTGLYESSWFIEATANIISACIGLCIVFIVIDFLSGQQGVTA